MLFLTKFINENISFFMINRHFFHANLIFFNIFLVPCIEFIMEQISQKYSIIFHEFFCVNYSVLFKYNSKSQNKNLY